MTHPRAVIAYRYSITDVDRWPESVVEVFIKHLRTKERNR